eukprot:Mycagemm_TRINITY_DN9630_c0_g1::TRINITY_DN9630_c0_g1_i1::g.2602::m.2602 type:complete len:119 gc:universal TRINITY_DN9630_c0_g1_i1:451-807(+)
MLRYLALVDTPRTSSCSLATHSVSCRPSPSLPPSRPCTTLSLATPRRSPVPKWASLSQPPPSRHALAMHSSSCTLASTLKCSLLRFASTAPTCGSSTLAGMAAPTASAAASSSASLAR